MNEMLKGNYKLKNQENLKSKDEPKKDASIESLFESSAFEKLGGSMAFVKKSASFLWKGEKPR